MKIRWAIIVPLIMTGCNRGDGEALARIGTTLVNRADALVDRAPPLANPLRTKQTRRERVIQRLQGDKLLATAAIEVVETARGVGLRGRVPDETAKNRAMELAGSTVDVDDVEDELTVDLP